MQFQINYANELLFTDANVTSVSKALAMSLDRESSCELKSFEIHIKIHNLISVKQNLAKISSAGEPGGSKGTNEKKVISYFHVHNFYIW